MSAAWLLLFLQAPAQVPASPTPSAEAPSKVAPYQGSLREGRLEVARLSKRDEHAAARELAQSLLAKPDFELAPELERAEALYAIGLAYGRAGEIPEAVEHFHRARGVAGSGELGRAAAYNSGTFLLLGAESLRQQIPELREKLGLPPLEPDPSATAGGGAQTPDALDVARQAYLAARAELADALRSERRAEDVRANLELCVRRLRELDALERQREEQQQEQEEQQEQDSKDREQQSNDSQDSKEPQQKPDSEQKPPQDPQDSQDKPDPSEEENPSKEEPEEREPKPEESKESEPKPDESKELPQLSPEEMQRLLQQLQQIDEKAKQVEAMLRERRRQPVKRDW